MCPIARGTLVRAAASVWQRNKALRRPLQGLPAQALHCLAGKRDTPAALRWVTHTAVE